MIAYSLWDTFEAQHAFEQDIFSMALTIMVEVRRDGEAGDKWRVIACHDVRPNEVFTFEDFDEMASWVWIKYKYTVVPF